jgi:hypothetical protein
MHQTKCMCLHSCPAKAQHTLSLLLAAVSLPLSPLHAYRVATGFSADALHSQHAFAALSIDR